MGYKRLSFIASWGVAVLLWGSSPASAQVSLGTAADFAVLAGTTVTNTGPSVIGSSLGVNPGTSVTGFPPGIVTGGGIHAGDAVAAQAQSEVTTAYNALAAQPVDVNLSGQDLGGLTLTPGVYSFATSAQLTGALTLDAQGDPNATFTFQIGNALTTSNGSSVTLINGAQNCKIFWQVGGSATIGPGTAFIGNILTMSSVTLNAGASLSGRALARNGSVTMDTNSITVATCAAPVTIPGAPTIGTAAPGNASASIAFSAPTSDGGAAIDNYRATCTGATGATGAASPLNVIGLTNGSSYACTVAAHNSIGWSAESAASNSVTPVAPPGAPAAPTASAGNARASVTFTAPVSNGSAIIGYTVVSSPAGGVDSAAGTTALTHSMTGLTNGTAYTFTVTASNGVGTSNASAASNSVIPVAPVVAPQPPPDIPLLPISGTSRPSVVNLSVGDGPAFADTMVGLLSNALNMPLRFAEQNAEGSVTLNGFTNGHLVFMPYSFQVGDYRVNGVYPVGNGQYQVVLYGQSLVIAPAVVHLGQLVALLPGVHAAVGDNGVISATLDGVTYVVQPGIGVAPEAATGSAQLVAGGGGAFQFIDAQGNRQTLYSAFMEPATLRAILQTMDAGATQSIQFDGTAAVVLNGQRYSFLPDTTLGGIPADRVGQSWWQESPTRYRMRNLQTPGTSQGLTVKQ